MHETRPSTLRCSEGLPCKRIRKRMPQEGRRLHLLGDAKQQEGIMCGGEYMPGLRKRQEEHQEIPTFDLNQISFNIVFMILND